MEGVNCSINIIFKDVIHFVMFQQQILRSAVNLMYSYCVTTLATNYTMWSWIAGNVNSLTETLQNTIPSSVSNPSPEAAPFPSNASSIIKEETATNVNTAQSDSSEQELDSTEPVSKPKTPDSVNISPKVEVSEDPSINLNIKEMTNSGLNTFTSGISNLFNDVTGVVKSSVSEFLTAEEQVQKKSEDTQAAQMNVAPPWYGYNEAEEMKTQIIDISSSSKNLLREPPPGSTMLPISLDSCIGQAMVMLSEDPRLEQVRFALVPKKISEDKFWRNYFYRVHLVKQSIQLGTLKREGMKAETDGNSNTTASVPPDEIEPDEFVSDALDNQASCEHKLTQEELNQLKLSTSPNKQNEESNMEDMLAQELENFQPDEVKDDVIDFEELDKILENH